MSYGPPLFRYDGSASLTYSQAEQSLRFEGRFRANQFNDGSLVIGLAPTALPIGHISDSADDGLNVSVKGLTKDGWSLETLGNTLAPSPIALLLGSAKHIYRPHYLRAYPDDGSMDDHNKVRFLLSTLLFHQPAHSQVQPISLEAQGFRVSLHAIQGYMGAANRIENGNMIEPTAEVFVETSNGKRLPLEDYKDFMNSLVYAFRLATGTGVEWYYGEAIDDSSGQVVERIHRGAFHGPFSNKWRSQYPNPDFSGIAKAYLDYRHTLGADTLKELINYFVTACDRTLALETAGVLASTLTELAVAKHAGSRGTLSVLDEENFRKNGLPELETAIRAAGLSNLPRVVRERLQKRAMDALKGAYRTSFRQRLKNLVDDFGIPLNSRDRMVKIRNALVHDGTYATELREWINDNRFVIWLDFVVLCRFIGYTGEIPGPQQDWVLGRA